MKIKFYKEDDFVNYKKCSLFIGTTQCTWKCCREAGIPCSVCQNHGWNTNPTLDIEDEWLIHRYLKNPLEEAVVIGGLEPMDTFDELYSFIQEFRCVSNDDIVIYTGYYPEEIQSNINKLKEFSNIIIKFGRYVPNSESRYDEVLGVTLASKNQFAQKIS